MFSKERQKVSVKHAQRYDHITFSLMQDGATIVDIFLENMSDADLLSTYS